MHFKTNIAILTATQASALSVSLNLTETTPSGDFYKKKKELIAFHIMA